MRLIDADALENDTRKVLKKSYTFSTHTFLALHMMLDIIKDRETIRAEPVKHGEWLSYSLETPKKDFICSECRSFIRLGYYAYKCYYNYCPNCGVKMDGGIEDDSERIS